MRCASLLRENNAKIISVTSTGDNSVSRYADERLYIATMEKQFSKIGLILSISVNTVLSSQVRDFICLSIAIPVCHFIAQKRLSKKYMGTK